MAAELTEMVGDDVYRQLAKYLRTRTKELSAPVSKAFLPHPAIRKKPTA